MNSGVSYLCETMPIPQRVCRFDVVDAMCQIHRAGIRYNDFAEYNVLNRNGVPIIIDFEDATEEVCQCKMEIIEDAFTPHPPDFNCKELFDVCQELEIWKPCTYLYLGHISLPPSYI